MPPERNLLPFVRRQTGQSQCGATWELVGNLLLFGVQNGRHADTASAKRHYGKT